jgi:nitroreductase
MDLQEAIIRRRSVRRFTEYYVTDAEITGILEAARWAPSWANTQVWEFIVVRDKDTIQKVADSYTELNPAIKCTKAASVLIVACAKKGVSGCYDGKDTTKFSTWYMFDLGLAVQNICLKAHELGLGTVVVGLLDHDKCRNVLSVPDDHEVVAVIPVGRPAVAGKEGPPRKEMKSFIHLDRFGNRTFME